MNAPVSRRALLGATAALGAVVLPTIAVAETVIPASDLDAELFALLDRWHAARVVWNASEAPFNAVCDRARAAYPPRPDALQWRASDFPRTSYGRGASDPVGDTSSREYCSRGADWLRRVRPSVQWDEAAEARRREIVEAHEAWMQARKAVEDATGYTAAVEEEMALADALNDAEAAMKVYQPHTVTGLAHKALWVADLLAREAGDDDLAEVFARQVAAFGGIGDARSGPVCSSAFDAAAFLEDLKAAGCDVVLMMSGTSFGPGDAAATYFIRPAPGYTAVMAKWSDAMDACPDAHERVVARLAVTRGVDL